MADKKTHFPKDFLWGASTASHQVEGATHNQWTVWELAVASEQAKTAKERLGWLPDWKEFADEAEDPNNYVSGRGVEHFRKYEQDFDLLNDLNLNAFRFGIEWSRIEPEEGVLDQAAIEHYERYIDALKERGITPVINLWHWTMPVWFAEMGGFEKKANIAYFERFIAGISKRIISKCKYVITLNEPNVYIGLSYGSGQWPPQKTNPITSLQVFYNLVLAHRRVYKLLKKRHPSMQIGVATQLSNGQPLRPGNLLDKLTCKVVEYGWNWWYLNRINKHQDFVGFNYYFTDFYKGFGRHNPTRESLLRGETYQKTHGTHRPKIPINDLGWYMNPAGIYDVIMRIDKRYKKPIIVTENGVADLHDQYRAWWLSETMKAMDQALQDGANLRGYFHWSLLDNFEWAYGWWPRFGLVAVDREHGMKRTVRKSARVWARWLASQKG